MTINKRTSVKRNICRNALFITIGLAVWRLWTETQLIVELSSNQQQTEVYEVLPLVSSKPIHSESNTVQAHGAHQPQPQAENILATHTHSLASNSSAASLFDPQSPSSETAETHFSNPTYINSQNILQKTTTHALTRPSQRPPSTLGAFIHIGKTAGSTISQLLRNGCHLFVPKPCRNETIFPLSRENAISKLTTYYHVPDFQERNLLKNHEEKPYDFFVITLRDPLSRTISSFASKHPFRRAIDKKQFIGVQIYECFETLDEYAKLLKNFSNFKENTWEHYFEKRDCANAAKTTLHHIATFPMSHHFWDLRQTLFQVHKGLRDKTLLSIRQEFLWQDWTSSNRWLGDNKGEIYTTTESFRNSTDMNLPIDLTLSEEGKINLCIALKDEYRLYLKVLALSVNLSKDEVRQSLIIARTNCPCLDLKLPMIDEIEHFSVSTRVNWDF